MTLYTFVTEHNGGTALQQIEAGDVGEAVRLWNLRMATGRLDPEPPVSVTGLHRAWCFSGLDADESLYLVHVIETAHD